MVAGSALLSITTVVLGLVVVDRCRPSVPLFDHAVLMADMLHQPPHLFRGHNEHLPVLPRLVFWLEALVTSGDPRLPVAIGLSALAAASLTATRAWRGGLRLLAGLWLFAALVRPSLAWSVSWPTNIQYPLSLLGAAVAFSAAHRRAWWMVAAGGIWAALSSAEGLLVLPLAAGFGMLRGQRQAALAMGGLSAALVMLTTTGGSSGLRLPATGVDLQKLVSFVGELVAFPWSVRLWSVLVAPLLAGSAWWTVRSRRADPVMVLMALYGMGFAALVVAGRWWLDAVHHRYALGGTVAVVAATLSVALAEGEAAARGLRWSPLLLPVGLVVVLALEAVWLAPPIWTACRARPPAGTEFWLGQTDDGSAAHPGFPVEIALELRDHLWRAGLYRPPTAPPAALSGE